MILFRPAFIIGGWDCVDYSNPSCPHGWPADYCGVLRSSVHNGPECLRCGSIYWCLETTDISSWHLAQRQGFELNSRGIISNFVQDTGKVTGYLWFLSILQNSNFPFPPHYFYLPLFLVFFRKWRLVWIQVRFRAIEITQVWNSGVRTSLWYIL